jgi:hypothetical protein
MALQIPLRARRWVYAKRSWLESSHPSTGSHSGMCLTGRLSLAEWTRDNGGWGASAGEVKNDIRFRDAADQPP